MVEVLELSIDRRSAEERRAAQKRVSRDRRYAEGDRRRPGMASPLRGKTS